jgi:hypothetical protein
MNALPIFVLFCHPLKFLFTFLVNRLLVLDDVHTGGGRLEPPIEAAQMPALMMIFGAGYVAVSLIFLLLYGYAYRRRAELDLDPRETVDTVESIAAAAINGSVGAFSFLIAAVGGPRYAPWAGVAYFLNAPLHTARGFWGGVRRRKLRQ